MKHETLTQIERGLFVGGMLALGFLSAFGFSDQIKKEARARQHNKCPLCGQPLGSCEGHHRIPESMGGSSTNSRNCIMLHSDKNRQDCHETADRMAIDHGMMITDQGTFIPFSEAPPEYFKNERVRQQTLQRFNIGEAIEGVVEFFRGHPHHHKHKDRHYRGQGGRRR